MCAPHRIAKLPPTKASMQTYNITASSGKESVALADVLFGEVWVCSGQVCPPIRPRFVVPFMDSNHINLFAHLEQHAIPFGDAGLLERLQCQLHRTGQTMWLWLR